MLSTTKLKELQLLITDFFNSYDLNLTGVLEIFAKSIFCIFGDTKNHNKSTIKNI